jgi:hypothetical protein
MPRVPYQKIIRLRQEAAERLNGTRTGSRPPNASDKAITVGFTPPDQWSFSAGSVSMLKYGWVLLRRAPGSKWKFAGVEIPGSGVEFRANVGPERIDIEDKHSREGAFDIIVTVTHNDGETYRNDDDKVPPPQIINAGPDVDSMPSRGS